MTAKAKIIIIALYVIALSLQLCLGFQRIKTDPDKAAQSFVIAFLSGAGVVFVTRKKV